jgi:AcrR family transcriptional regulator
MEVFGQRGFRGGTLQQVAERVGGTPGAILKLFGSKENLLIAVLEHWGAVTSELVGFDNRGYQRLEGFKRLMSYHTEHVGLLQLYTTMAAEATTIEHPAHDFMTNRYQSTLADMRQLFRDGGEQGQFRLMGDDEINREAQLLLATMDGLEVQFLLDPSTDLEGSFAHYVNLLTQRLAPQSEPEHAFEEEEHIS